MKLGIIVTEFPKTTETFILRDLLHFHECGHEVRIYHLAPYRRSEIVHDFARPALAWVRPVGSFLGGRGLAALARGVLRRPGKVFAVVARMAWGYRSDPLVLLKSLALLPRCFAVAEDLAAWRAGHVHAEFAGHPATCAWIVGRMTGLPYSVSCRAHDIFRSQAMLGTKLGEASFVRTISQFNRRFLLDRLRGLDESKLSVIHSSVDLSKIPPLPAPHAGTFRVLYVGSLQLRKGVDVLLQALAGASELGDWACDIIGGGPEAECLSELARSLGVSDRVRFMGPQPFEAVSAAYAAANVVAVPSVIGPKGRTEGIPNVVIEALAHQRPVIATNVSGVPELVTDGVTGWLVRPGDPIGLRAALHAIRRDPETAYRIALRGRQRVENEFDLAKSARAQLEKFAQHAAGQEARRPSSRQVGSVA
jgi:glycosyltransferase involved in cell wall biosynthesis